MRYCREAPFLLLSPGASPGQAGALPLPLPLPHMLCRVEVLPLHSHEQEVSGVQSQDHAPSQAGIPELPVLSDSLI